MMTQNQKYVLGGVVALLAIAGTAIGASYVTAETIAPKPVPVAATPAPVVAQAAPVRPQPAPVHHAAARPACNDHNIVGTVGGALAGGLVGHQFGKGTGRTVATVGGAAGGAYLGNEYIPTRGVACN